MKPSIAITSNHISDNRKLYKLKTTYIKSIIKAGGLPYIIPSLIEIGDCEKIIQSVDGLILPGGWDIAPDLFGEESHPKVVYTVREVDLFEIELLKLAQKHGKPVLGICRGAQIINVAFGGTLYQDIPSQYKNEISHLQNQHIIDQPIHKVYMEDDSNLARIFGKKLISVNSQHHQSVKDIGEGLEIVGRAADGVIEAIETRDGMILGVQWHPEELAEKQEEQMNLFHYLIEKSKENIKTIPYI